MVIQPPKPGDGIKMSFFKKSKPKTGLLDIPPPPPPMAKGEDELPALSSLEEEIPPPPQEDYNLFPAPDKEAENFPELPKLEPLSEVESDIYEGGPLPEALPELAQFKPEMTAPRSKLFQPKVDKFMKISTLRDILEGASQAQSTLRESKKSLMLISGADAEKERRFEEWRKGIEEINKKVMLIDRILFRG